MLKRLLAVLGLAFACSAPAADWWDAPRTRAYEHGPLSADETRAFMRELAQYIFDHHLKRDEQSAQRGMVYEYFNTKRAGHPDHWIQGEALDSMHDADDFEVAIGGGFRAKVCRVLLGDLAKQRQRVRCGERRTPANTS